LKRAIKRGAVCRSAILNSAIKLFHAQGFQATNLRDVAAHAGVFLGSIHYHFGSKQRILYEIVQEVMNKSVAVLDRQVAKGGTPIEVATNILTAHLEFVLQNRIPVSVFLHEYRSLEARYRRMMTRQESRIFGRFVEVLRRGQEQGLIIEGDARLIGQGAVGVINWSYRWYKEECGISIEEVKSTLVGFIMRAISKRKTDTSHLSRHILPSRRYASRVAVK